MTEREVRLRDVTESDLPVFFEDQRDSEANRMAAFPPRDREAFMVHWAKILRDPAVTKKTILFDGEVAGNILEKCGFEIVGRTSRPPPPAETTFRNSSCDSPEVKVPVMCRRWRADLRVRIGGSSGSGP